MIFLSKKKKERKVDGKLWGIKNMKGKKRINPYRSKDRRQN